MSKQITLDFFRRNISDDCMCLVVDQNGFYYYGCLPMLQFLPDFEPVVIDWHFTGKGVLYIEINTPERRL